MKPGAEGLSSELLNVADRLVQDFAEVPAGSVLRCLALAVQAARASGSSPADLGEQAERLARDMLQNGAGWDEPDSVTPDE